MSDGHSQEMQESSQLPVVTLLFETTTCAYLYLYYIPYCVLICLYCIATVSVFCTDNQHEED
jgi:ABC-type antimicrobial peptide transport system permease subunit